MPTAREHLALWYPHLVTVGDPRYPGADVLAGAEAVAFEYRPKCLSEERQNLAQAHYMAYLIGARVASAAGTVTASNVIRRAKEGDVEVEYATEGSASSDGGATSPYAAWRALADICARGAIITRFG